jgi:hypothetical protein
MTEVKRLAETLSQCESVARFDTDEESEAWTLAHCFSHLEASFRTILEQHLPALISERLTQQDVEDRLLDIGEEFRHILYHLRDPRYYRYLLEDPRNQ